LIHITLGIVDFLMVLMWAGLGLLAWIVGIAGVTILSLAGITIAIRAAWRRHAGLGGGGPAG